MRDPRRTAALNGSIPGSENAGHLATGSTPGDCPDCHESRATEAMRDLRDDIALSGLTRATLTSHSVGCALCHGRAPGCCYQAVGLSLAEAVEIVAAYPTLVQERYGVLVIRAAMEREVIGEAAGGVTEGDDIDRKESRRLRREGLKGGSRWFARRLPCPFLTREGQCAVYDARPLTCAGWTGLGLPAMCAPTGSITQDSVPGGGLQMDLSAKRAELARRAKDKGVPVALRLGIAGAVVEAVDLLSRLVPEQTAPAAGEEE